MKRFVSLLLISLLLALPAAPISRNKLAALKEVEHRSMHEIVMLQRDDSGKILDGGLCTAYAVGPHTLLTAEHCNLETDKVYLDPVDRESVKEDKAPSFKIIDREFDDEDHMLLDIEGVNFKDTTYLGPRVRVAVQGEKVYFWGNPAGVKDQYREGLVVGSKVYTVEDGDASQGSILTVVQAPTVGGDSGSAVFSDRDGALVGVVTYSIFGGLMMGMFPIEFTGEQIEQASK
jgi:hypothetical protein